MTIGVLLLAAGTSQRFGSDKRFARLDDGGGLLQASVGAIQRSGLPLRVALRPGDTAAAAVLAALHATALQCPNAARGMGSTIADALPLLPPWEGLLIALADMPAIRPSTFIAVAAALESAQLVSPVYRGRPGHPVGFSRGLFARLATLSGDQGARQLLREPELSRQLLPVDDPGIHRDIDQPADLARWSG